MSSHPGSRLSDAVELALYTKEIGLNPEQVQDYYPTPGTASTVMFYTGIDPLTGKEIYCPTDYREKQLQRALLQYRRPENRSLVREALKKCGREDLIGFSKDCLVTPDMRKGQSAPAKFADKSKGSKNDTKKSPSKDARAKNGPKKSEGKAKPSQKSAKTSRPAQKANANKNPAKKNGRR